MSKNCEIILIADDTNIFVLAQTKELAYKISQETLYEISNYMNLNKNHCKTEENENSTKFELIISNTPFPKFNQTKFLGVVIDDRLTWLPHIKSLVKKLYCCTGRFNRIFQFIPISHHENLYHTLFES